MDALEVDRIDGENAVIPIKDAANIDKARNIVKIVEYICFMYINDDIILLYVFYDEVDSFINI